MAVLSSVEKVRQGWWATHAWEPTHERRWTAAGFTARHRSVDGQQCFG